MMAIQGLFFRSFVLTNNSRFLFNNRLPQVSQVCGIRRKVVEDLKNLDVPEKPKRPLTPYFRFLRDKRSSIAKQYPNWKITQVAAQCAAEWKKIDELTKEKYEDSYKAEMEVYAKKYTEYISNLTSEQKEAIKAYKDEVKQSKIRREKKQKNREYEKPKRPIGAYMMYVMEQAKSDPKKSYQNLLVELKGKWAEMPDGEKAPYLQAAAKAKQQYDEDMKQWETKMIQLGNLDLVRQTTLMGKSPKSPKQE